MCAGVGEAYTAGMAGAVHDDRQRRLARDVAVLAGDIGERHVWRPGALQAAADHIEAELIGAGVAVQRQGYVWRGQSCWNLEVQIVGDAEPGRIVIVGAHYDTVRGSPGANDNASAVAVLLELARALAGCRLRRTLRLVAFTNEESPFAWSERMGSKVYANRCRARGERVAGMLALDGLGCFRDERGSQRYPPPLGLVYPSRGDFLGFVGNFASARLLWASVRAFGRGTSLPVRAAVLPGWLPVAARSDHWSFWRLRYPAVLVTDTLEFRDPHYHRPTDTPEKLDYARLAAATAGLEQVVGRLAGRR